LTMGSSVGAAVGAAVAGATVAGATVAGAAIGAGVVAGAQADRPSTNAMNNPTNNEIFFDISTLLFFEFLVSHLMMV
jgi:hypothetical protein